jgi:two-component system sensor histidine kinase FlrB
MSCDRRDPLTFGAEAERVSANRAQLVEAFEAFNRVSEALSGSYQDLQSQVAGLQAELAAARDARLRQLAETERLAGRLGAILEALPGAVLVLDREGRVEEVNPTARDWLGEPLLGEAWSTVLGRLPGRREGDALVLADGRQLSVASRLLEPTGRIVLLTDETERERLRDQAERNERLAALGEMVASLAHQVRTPLASALLYVSQLTRPGAGPALAEKGLHCLRRLDGMVNEMLLFARGDDTAAVAVPVRIDTLLEGLRAQIEPQLKDRLLNIELHPALAEAEIEGQRDALGGALLNLIDNALEAGAGEVLLSAEPEGERGLLLRVCDDGPGIDPVLRPVLFEPFVTGRSGGTGLGLAVVRRLIEAHGGRIEASEAVEHGASFLIHLPLRVRATPLASGPVSAARATEEEVYP